jgi:hypothetical protein
MKRTLMLGADDLIPAREAVLAHQGIPPGTDVSARILRLHRRAEEAFVDYARPVGLIGEIDKSDFAGVFAGAGDNAEDAVVGLLLGATERIALFAATIGRRISERIEELFAANEYALGSMLDSVASMAADNAADTLASWYRAGLRKQAGAHEDLAVLPYSPGYCGWHITGQRQLFAWLAPENIGISLNPSCMMSPLKSVSGALLAARPEVHLFKPRFSYCPDCRQRSCIGRMQPLRQALRGA